MVATLECGRLLHQRPTGRRWPRWSLDHLLRDRRVFRRLKVRVWCASNSPGIHSLTHALACALPPCAFTDCLCCLHCVLVQARGAAVRRLAARSAAAPSASRRRNQAAAAPAAAGWAVAAQLIPSVACPAPPHPRIHPHAQPHTQSHTNPPPHFAWHTGCLWLSPFWHRLSLGARRMCTSGWHAHAPAVGPVRAGGTTLASLQGLWVHEEPHQAPDAVARGYGVRA